MWTAFEKLIGNNETANSSARNLIKLSERFIRAVVVLYIFLKPDLILGQKAYEICNNVQQFDIGAFSIILHRSGKRLIGFRSLGYLIFGIIDFRNGNNNYFPQNFGKYPFLKQIISLVRLEFNLKHLA